MRDAVKIQLTRCRCVMHKGGVGVLGYCTLDLNGRYAFEMYLLVDLRRGYGFALRWADISP